MNSYYRNGESIRFEMTTPEQEKELFQKAKAGDQAAREFLIRNHLLFAANYGRRKTAGKLSDDEVVSACNAAVMTAIDRFDPAWGNRFTRYLIPFLRGAIADLWKSKNTVECEGEATSRLFEDYEEGDRTEEGARTPHRVPREAQVDSPADLLMEEEQRSATSFALAACMAELPKDEREVIRLIYFEGLSRAEVGRRRKISREMVRRIHDKILAKLKERMNGRLS